jgi:hypothetical protein
VLDVAADLAPQRALHGRARHGQHGGRGRQAGRQQVQGGQARALDLFRAHARHLPGQLGHVVREHARAGAGGYHAVQVQRLRQQRVERIARHEQGHGGAGIDVHAFGTRHVGNGELAAAQQPPRFAGLHARATGARAHMQLVVVEVRDAHGVRVAREDVGAAGARAQHEAVERPYRSPRFQLPRCRAVGQRQAKGVREPVLPAVDALGGRERARIELREHKPMLGSRRHLRTFPHRQTKYCLPSLELCMHFQHIRWVKSPARRHPGLIGSTDKDYFHIHFSS